jgi:hypothetical protein
VHRVSPRVLPALLVAFAVNARADVPASTEPIRIRYSAPAACPGETEFRREVFSRTARARVATGDEAARSFAVTIAEGADGSRGRLETTPLDGVTTAREVAGADCREVAAAVALIVALAVDPQARTGPPEEGAAAAAAGTPPPQPSPVPTAPAVVEPPTPPEPPAPEPEGFSRSFRWSAKGGRRRSGSRRPSRRQVWSSRMEREPA